MTGITIDRCAADYGVCYGILSDDLETRSKSLLISKSFVDRWDECCTMCIEEKTCSYWTWASADYHREEQHGTCWMKRNASANLNRNVNIDTAGLVSGIISSRLTLLSSKIDSADSSRSAGDDQESTNSVLPDLRERGIYSESISIGRNGETETVQNKRQNNGKGKKEKTKKRKADPAPQNPEQATGPSGGESLERGLYSSAIGDGRGKADAAAGEEAAGESSTVGEKRRGGKGRKDGRRRRKGGRLLLNMLVKNEAGHLERSLPRRVTRALCLAAAPERNTHTPPVCPSIACLLPARLPACPMGHLPTALRAHSLLPAFPASPRWAPLIDFWIIGIDSNNTDNTPEARPRRPPAPIARSRAH